MDEHSAIAALINDLHAQIDQLKPRGIKDNAGNPYNPSYYKRGLDNAIERGGFAVADYVRGYLHKPPSDGYRKLEIAHGARLGLVEHEPFAGELEGTPLHRRRPCRRSRAVGTAHRRRRSTTGGQLRTHGRRTGSDTEPRADPASRARQLSRLSAPRTARPVISGNRVTATALGDRF